jgi:hypothetical protein
MRFRILAWRSGGQSFPHFTVVLVLITSRYPYSDDEHNIDSHDHERVSQSVSSRTSTAHG